MVVYPLLRGKKLNKNFNYISLDQMLKRLKSNNLAKVIMDVVIKGGDFP
jgi:hypothetical protein